MCARPPLARPACRARALSCRHGQERGGAHPLEAFKGGQWRTESGAPRDGGDAAWYSLRPTPAAPQVEKEGKFFNPKTKYTCNPCASIALGNGLGMRSA